MASTPSVPKKFHPPKSFSFPKRSFGCSGNQRSFRSEWCEEFEWLHYDTATDTAYCHLCLCTEADRRFLASTKRDPAFISWGYYNWKDAKVAFTKHIESACHKEAVQADKLLKQTGDIGEMLNTAHSMEKALNREMLRHIMQNLRFLARQDLLCVVVTMVKTAISHSFYACEQMTAQLSLDGWTRKLTNIRQGTFRTNCFR